MRSLAVVVVVLLLALLAWLVFRSGESAAPLQPAPEKSVPLSQVETPISSTAVESTSATNEASRQSAKEPAAAPSTSPACTVFGKVVDAVDAPLVGAKVRLSAYKSWAEGQDVPRLPGKLDIRGFETSTDAQGKFTFGVPLPTVTTVVLQVLPDDFHDSAREFLGGTDARFKPPLHAGENDLGQFRLVATGAIRGRVSDANGAPLENAHFTVGTERSNTISRDADSDAGGNFVIGHVPQGTYGVNAKCEGFLSEFRKPIEVHAGQMSGPVDYALLAAPVLAGMVVDEQGRGLAGAKLWGWPSTSGAGAGGKSSADGSFTFFLPQNEPYTLEVTLDGYDSFGTDDRNTHYAPNTRDLRIVLKQSADAKTRFVVLDDSSGAKIESFGLEIERDRGSRADRNGWTNYRARPKPVAHPGGEVEVSARPGLDLYTVLAPGYTRKSGDVEHASKDSNAMTVKLARGGGLLGRALVGSSPVAGVALRLEAKGEDVQQVSSDAQGRFRFDSLDPGTYQLTLRAPTGESLEVTPVHIRMKGDTDLGDLVLVKGATIAGRVLVPERRASGGLTVFLDGLKSGVKQTTDVEGRFRFEAVTAGHHTLTLDDVPGAIASGAKAELDLAAGEMKEVVLDARDFGTCKVALTIEIPGQTVEGLSVYLLPQTDPTKSLRLGQTDAKGLVNGSVRAVGSAKVQVMLPHGSTLRHPSAQIALALDRDVESTVRFEVGSVRFELPSTLQLPQKGTAMLEFVGDLKDGTTPFPLWANIGETSDRMSAMQLESDGRHFLAKLVLASEFDANFVITAQEPNAEQHELYRSPVHVAVRPGETTAVQLP